MKLKSITNYFGRCPRCMRRSFIIMLFAWGMALVIMLMSTSPMLSTASKVLAAGLSALWSIHLMAYSLRAARNTSPKKEVDTDVSLTSRRQFAFSLAKSLIVAAAVTALPIRTVSAQVACNCPNNFPKCCYNKTKTTYICVPVDAICCESEDEPWSCSNGTACYGADDCR